MIDLTFAGGSGGTGDQGIEKNDDSSERVQTERRLYTNPGNPAGKLHQQRRNQMSVEQSHRGKSPAQVCAIAKPCLLTDFSTTR